MSDVVPEQSVVKTPEAVTPKPAEDKPVEKPLGAPEQAIIQKIQQDSDPDEALRDIAETKPSATAQTPDKPALDDAVVANYLRMTDGLAKQLLKGGTTPETLQSYINSIREQGVPRDQVEEVLLVRGITVARKAENAGNNGAQPLQEVNQNATSDVEILRRAFDIEPLNVTSIRENPNLQRRNFNRNAITLASQGDQTTVQYESKDWYKIDGKLRAGTINGQPKKFIFTNTGAGAASFDSFTDTYVIQPAALERFKSDPDRFSSDLLHEIGHDQYTSLTQAKQRELNDLFLQTPMFRDALFRFGTVLYGGEKIAGDEDYLTAHSITNKGILESGIVSSDGEKGFKDTRSLVFELNGQKQEIFAAALITEYVSYMSSLTMNREIFDKSVAQSRAVRGASPRLDAIFLGFKRLQADSQIKQAFDSYGIFKDNTPQLASDFAKIASTI